MLNLPSGSSWFKKSVEKALKKEGVSLKKKSRSKGGKREDLGGMYFRSAWEANFARYLNYLQNKLVVRSWAYEPKTFEFHPIKRGNRFYTPDFEVIEWLKFGDEVLGKVEKKIYYEIKGYMDASSLTKLKRMKKYYPEINVVLVDAKAYRAIASQARKLIPNWE